MRHIVLFVAMFTSCLCVSARTNREADDGKEMDGTWVPTDAELAGQKFPEDILKTMKLTINGEKYTVTIGEVVDKGTVKLFPTTKPKGIDIKGTEGPNKGKTFLAIYEHKDDTLRVCYDLAGKKRPTEFKTAKDTKLFLVTYKREKN